MAQNDGEVNVQIKLGADVSGGVQSRAELEKLKAKAREINASNTAFNGFANSLKGVSKAARALNAVMAGFGWVTIILNAVSAIKEWYKSLHKAEESARNLRKEMEMKAAAAQVKEVASAYKELTDAINETKEARQRDQQVFDEEVRVRREAEDAEMAADEADALAAVDPNAEDADKQRQRIRETFGAKRKRLTADRKAEDVVLRRQKLQGEADGATAAADKLEESLGADDKAILRAKTRANTLEALSKERNDKDGTWYNPRKKTEEGDAVREQQRKEAEKAREEVKRLEADKNAKEKQIADLRAQASTSLKIRDVIGRSISTAELERDNANVEEATQTAANAAADKKEAEKKAKEKDKVDDAQKAYEMLQAEKTRIESQKAAAQARKDAANLNVSNAEGELETAKLGGKKSQQQSAYSNLQQVKATAQDVAHEADKEINELNETLKNVLRVMQAARSELEKAKKQTLVQQAEQISG